MSMPFAWTVGMWILRSSSLASSLQVRGSRPAIRPLRSADAYERCPGEDSARAGGTAMAGRRPELAAARPLRPGHRPAGLPRGEPPPVQHPPREEPKQGEHSRDGDGGQRRRQGCRLDHVAPLQRGNGRASRAVDPHGHRAARGGTCRGIDLAGARGPVRRPPPRGHEGLQRDLEHGMDRFRYLPEQHRGHPVPGRLSPLDAQAARGRRLACRETGQRGAAEKDGDQPGDDDRFHTVGGAPQRVAVRAPQVHETRQPSPRCSPSPHGGSLPAARRNTGPAGRQVCAAVPGSPRMYDPPSRAVYEVRGAPEAARPDGLCPEKLALRPWRHTGHSSMLVCMQTQDPSRAVATRSWQVTLFAGIVTLILGIIVAVHPTGSLNVIAVLLGILLIISGIFHLIRVFDSGEPHRVWLGIAGLLFIVAGVILIRHLHLTLAIIGLFIGITWIIQGVVALIAGISGGSREGRGWWIAFGIISIIAGIVVTATPVSSVTVLAVLVGIWFIVMGAIEIIGAFMFRHAIRTEGLPAA